MFKRILMIAGMLLVGIASLSLINKPLEVDTDDTNKKMKESLVTKEERSIDVLREKLHEKYVGVDVKTTSKKELVIQVVADKDYFNSVKKDMASIAKRVIETSPLKDYTVVFERWELSSLVGETSMTDKAFPLLIETLAKGLKEYEVFENIVIEVQPFIMVNTSIKGSGKDARKLAMEIKEKVNEMLYSKELDSIADIDSYEIVILNASGEVIN
ncbi:hypothetical protein ACIQ2D_15445 [Lysinibacillus sp. NPDC097287]|uniref:hypothetical protein n=1 Tax=Lysinibacillus sp. NPDC097287 TaxID=3364144 RepID=UPI003830D6D5